MKSGSGLGMNNPDHISESLETIFWVQILQFLRDGKIRIRDKHPGSARLNPREKPFSVYKNPFVGDAR
jgi:hypothetical protein